MNEDKFIDEQAKLVWDYMLMHHEMKLMDAIFALGSNDLGVADRAADLYLQGLGQYVICAGANGKGSRLTKPEAEVFGDIVIARGVPKEKVILEPNSMNTGENVLFVKKLIEERGLKINSFILVQKPYMERRTFATFKKQWPGPDCVVTSQIISYEDYTKDPFLRKGAIETMVGDLIRIREYPKLGFQIEQDIPNNIWEAGQKLLELGFNKYALNL